MDLAVISLMRFFVNVVLRSFLIYVLSMGMVYYVSNLVDGFVGLCVVVLVSLLCSAILICLFGFDKADREVLRRMVYDRLFIKNR